MSERPAFGTAPIRCGRMRCTWRGFETDLKKVPESAGRLKGVCPTCDCDSYMFMTPREIAAWQGKGKAGTGGNLARVLSGMGLVSPTAKPE